MDEEDQLVDQRIMFKTPQQERKEHKLHQSSTLINLCLFASCTLVMTIIFMYTLAKKSRELEILPEHIDNQKLQCPQNTSFSPFDLTCIQCSQNCLECQPGLINKCVKCHPFYYLKNDGCVQICQNSCDGVCFKDEITGTFSIEEIITDLKVKQSFYQSVITYGEDNLIFIIPPMGNTFSYFSDLNYNIGQQMNATFITISTPFEFVMDFKEVDSQNAKEEQSNFVELIAKKYQSQIKTAKKVRIITMSDMVYFGHSLSRYIINQELCSDINLTILQTKLIQVIDQIKLSDQQLTKLLTYTQSLNDIKHKDHEKFITNEYYDSELAPKFRDSLRWNDLYTPTSNLQINLIIYQEQGSQNITKISNLNQYQKKLNQQTAKKNQN
ncbi:hypothetical protein pb186bvf_019355 [Paramecium bursaria]